MGLNFWTYKTRKTLEDKAGIKKRQLCKAGKITLVGQDKITLVSLLVVVGKRGIPLVCTICNGFIEPCNKNETDTHNHCI